MSDEEPLDLAEEKMSEIKRMNKTQFPYDPYVKPRLNPQRSHEEFLEYWAAHRFIRRKMGRASYCANDPTHKATKYHWSNISRQYRLDVTDWWSLCPTCHRKFDGISHEQRALHQKLAMGNTHRNRPVIRIDYERQISYYHESAKVACDELGILRSAVNNCLKGISKRSGGFGWMYAPVVRRVSK